MPNIYNSSFTGQHNDEYDDRISTLETEYNSRISILENFKLTFLNTVYPVGSIYISTQNINPGTLFGGTWEQIEDKFLLGASTTYTAGTTGGSINHSHKYGLQYGGYYRTIALENNSNAGLLNYDINNNISISTDITSISNITADVNNAATNAIKSIVFTHYRTIAQNEYVSNIPPYLSVYMWKRTA